MERKVQRRRLPQVVDADYTIEQDWTPAPRRQPRTRSEIDPGNTAIKYLIVMVGFFVLVLLCFVIVPHLDWIKANGWIPLVIILTGTGFVGGTVIVLRALKDFMRPEVLSTSDDQGNSIIWSPRQNRVEARSMQMRELPAEVRSVHTAQRYQGLPQQQEPPALPEPGPQIPTAPSFREMMHLINETRMPLCYISEMGQSVPAWGTIDDLLSMAIIGKPGRGKTTALMYYICMLLKCGAEVWIWDPHGTMAPLSAISHIPLAGMPETARLCYLDSREDVVNSVLLISGALEERDEEYRAAQARGILYRKHPILLLADELPVLADWDEQTRREYKALNAQRRQRRQPELEMPLLVDVMRRFVLEARKWRGFFIGSGQVIDHQILPTKVTDSLSSRIIFFSAERKARMAGLESDAIEKLLPVIRRAGSGVMVFDCARWDEPVIGAIPYIEPADMVTMLGGGGSTSPQLDLPQMKVLSDIPARNEISLGTRGYPPQTSTEPLAALPGTSPGDIPASSPAGTSPGDIGEHPQMSLEKERLFLSEYRKRLRLRRSADIKDVLKHCHIGNRYHRHASELARKVREEMRTDE